MENNFRLKCVLLRFHQKIIYYSLISTKQLMLDQTILLDIINHHCVSRENARIATSRPMKKHSADSHCLCQPDEVNSPQILLESYIVRSYICI